MKRYLALLSLVLLMAAVVFTGIGKMHSGGFKAPESARTASVKLEAERPMILPQGYVSSGDEHKIMISSDNTELYQDLLANGKVTNDQNYGSFRVVTVDTATLQNFQGRAEVRDDMNVITLNGYHLDTTNPEATLSTLPVAFTSQETLSRTAQGEKAAENGLYIVQFTGPVQDSWYSKLEKTGVKIVSYVANNGYVVEATGAQVKSLQGLKKSGERIIQYVGAYEPAFRTSTPLRNAYLNNGAGNVDITVQVVNGPNAQATLDSLKQMSNNVVREAHEVLAYQNITLNVPVERVAQISQMSNVFAVEPYYQPRLMDERQGQIMAGNIGASTVSAPGYLSFLSSKGFSGTGQFNFVVDITDDGVDKGSTTDVNNEFKVGGSASGASRVVYNNNYTGDTTSDGGGGHGNLNASIIFGYNNSTGSAYQDAGGYNYGLGICPFVKLGNTKVFSNGSAATFTQSATVRLKAAYQAGAVISSNSWGYTSGNTYNADSQEHDKIVRDADASTTGNQEMTVVFAAGNSGSGANTVAPPGTAKNIITVGANENDRQTGTDGCSTPNTGADNVNDVIDFSSRGPTADGRFKPEIGAPGTHIQGAASRSVNYTGGGVCDKYWPTGQTLYAWSSGTSHSTPATSGACALVRQYFTNQAWGTPSPAMVKAYLTNSARYMTGVFANDTIPSNNQGMGSVNLGTAFDGVSRVLVDQTQVLGSTGATYSVSGTIVNSTKPFRVSLAWTDAPGPTTGSAWVNNLDLEVTVNGTLYKGNVFSGRNSVTGGTADTKNNLESVFLPAGTTGNYTVTVKATNIAGDGVPGNLDTTDQDFALVVYNANTSSTPVPDFSMSSTPSTQSVVQGSPTSYTVNVSAVNGFNSNVSLAASGLPTGASASFSPTSISTGSGSSTMSVTTASTTPAGTYSITITGTSGSLTHATTVSLTVTPSGGGGGGTTVTKTYSNSTAQAIPDNNTTGITSTINVPDSLTITAVSVSVNITHTWRGDIQIDLVSPSGTTSRLKDTSSSDSADNVIATYAPTTFNGQNSAGAWKLIVRDLAAADTGTLNNWSLSITGTTGGGGGTTGDFSLSLATPTGSWLRGSTYTRTVYVTRTGGLTDPITLSLSSGKTGLYSSVTSTVNPVPNGTTSTVLTFKVSTTAPTGSTYTDIIGTDSTGRTRSTRLTLTIN